MQNSAELSVVTVALNSATTLRDCIESIQQQCVSAEHIVIDGGSTDRTSDVINSVSRSSLIFKSEPDRGIYDAINKGIGIAGGAIIGVLHADDVYADRDVAEIVMQAFDDCSVDAVYGDLDYVCRTDLARVKRRWTSGSYVPTKLYAGWMPPHPTFFVRRECYEKYGLYRLDLGTAADYELMLRFLLVHNIRVKYIPRVLVKMRTGGASNASLRARWQANRMDRKAWEVNNLKPYPWTLVAKPLRKVGQWWVR